MTVVHGDKWMVKVVLVSLLLMLLMNLYLDLQPMQPVKKPGVKCWVPATFPAPGSSYADSACGKNLFTRDEDGYAIGAWLPMDTNNILQEDMRQTQRVRLSNSSQELDKNKEDVKYYFIAEVVVVCAGFLILRTICDVVNPVKEQLSALLLRHFRLSKAAQIPQKESKESESVEISDLNDAKSQGAASEQENLVLQQLSTSRFASALYFLSKVFLTVVWLVIGGMLHSNKNAYISSWPHEMENIPPVFLCDFNIRVLGNIHRHTVQCTTDVAEPAPPQPDWMSVVVQANIVLCFFVAVVNIIHVFLIFVVGALGNANLLNNVHPGAPRSGVPWPFNDMVLALSLSMDT